MKKLFLSLMAMMGVLALSAQSVYDFNVKDDAGSDVSLSNYRSMRKRGCKSLTSRATSSELRLQDLYRRFTSSAPLITTSTSRSSTKSR